MALFDFLDQPVSGYTAPPSQAGTDFLRDDNGVQTPKGTMTWGELLGIINRGGGQKPNPQAPQGFGQSNPQNVYPLQWPQQQTENKSNTSLGEIASIASLFI